MNCLDSCDERRISSKRSNWDCLYLGAALGAEAFERRNEELRWRRQSALICCHSASGIQHYRGMTSVGLEGYFQTNTLSVSNKSIP